MADGVNLLAEVLDGEQVFLVGEFNDWNPQDPSYALDPLPGAVGQFSIEVEFPLTTANGPVLDAGSNFIYKFAKTSGDPGDVWANGIKDYFETDAVHTCPNVPAAPAGLYETGNYELIVPDLDAEVPTRQVAAWRMHAESFGYPACN